MPLRDFSQQAVSPKSLLVYNGIRHYTRVVISLFYFTCNNLIKREVDDLWYQVAV